MTRRARIAWAALLALGAFDAYAGRHILSPDGVSYLDLSDAIVNGRFGGVVNLYWSPLYPVLIGLARAVSGAGPFGEVAAVHVVNFAAFVGVLAAYEYLLGALRVLAGRRDGSILRGWPGDVIAYGLLGTVFIAMVPLSLTTPDLLSSAAVFASLGATLRLRERPCMRDGVVLGLSLGLGLLAKAYLVPWSVVCLAAAFVGTSRDARRPLLVALALWGACVAPWTAVLSARAGRPTFGDAGRLTFAWYVNGEASPSDRGVAPGARRADADGILPGVGITGDAPGTDPMWFDPARWNANVSPRIAPAQIASNAWLMTLRLIGGLAVFVFLILWIALADRSARPAAWRDGWVALVPAVAGAGGYLLVLTAARYTAAFDVAGILVVLATVPMTLRVRPAALLAGLTTALLLLVLNPTAPELPVLGVGVVAALAVGVSVRPTRLVIWTIAVSLALVLAVLNLPAGRGVPIIVLGAALVVTLWWMSRRAVSAADESTRFARSLYGALGVCAALYCLSRLLPVVALDLARARAGDPPDWIHARELEAHGVRPGARIALVGMHAQATWARTARLRMVASVPVTVEDAWWNRLDNAGRDSLLALFARDGAQFAVSSAAPPEGLTTGWTRLPAGLWVRAIAAAPTP